MYSKGRQQATGNKQEGNLARKKLKFPVDIHANFYTNDTNGHDITDFSTTFNVTN
ncbi:hypothetical protein [Okeania hirsuta]|uniref:hypothetical protein n=1 Tax=Okeania hirsuta TaxID=1458930 RepID=UPI001374E2CF|nr:hypothetical protein [Okeania hirsuta]